jgi:hypothetical protein
MPSEPHQAAAGAQQQQQQSPAAPSAPECDSSSDDEADFDSDSEVNGMSTGTRITLHKV